MLFERVFFVGEIQSTTRATFLYSIHDSNIVILGSKLQPRIKNKKIHQYNFQQDFLTFFTTRDLKYFVSGSSRVIFAPYYFEFESSQFLQTSE